MRHQSMAPERQAFGWNQRCHRCGSISLSIWSRLALGAPLPALEPITDVAGARLADAIDVEISCMGCFASQGAYRRAPAV